METLLGKVAKDGATEAAMKQVYDEAAAKQKSEEEISARHILVPTEEEAKAIDARDVLWTPAAHDEEWRTICALQRAITALRVFDPGYDPKATPLYAMRL